MDDREVANKLIELAGALQQHKPVRDWVDAHRDGTAFGSDVAAFISGCSTDTVRRRAVDSAAVGQPLGILQAGVWLFDLRRLLDWIERHQGLPARLAAETRAKKNAEMQVSMQNGPLSGPVAAVTAG
ncbi:hypothetical protein [Bradyrhizobium sp. LTSP885]|uniref:hypothetical protein n=1 Tax=Bradyrhizobium sp. LTSP885 TaxID=1619232 RepID=UPI0018CCB811|nr:hypothetical protein [Bradyrhizobium sp. LTSP885]